MRRMAMTTGLEPVTSGVTGRRSNQLNYATIKRVLPSEFHSLLNLGVLRRTTQSSSHSYYLPSSPIFAFLIRVRHTTVGGVDLLGEPQLPSQ